MSSQYSAQPSWQSLQRQSGAFTSSSYPSPSETGSEAAAMHQRPVHPQQQQQNQQQWRPSNAQSDVSSPNENYFRQNQPGMQQQSVPFPGSQSSSSTPAGAGMTKSSTMSNNLNASDNRASSPPLSPVSQQQQYHRRTQSLRPLSAFQPLEHPDNGYQPGSVGRSNGQQRSSSPTGSTTRSIRTAAAPLTFKSPELRSALGLQDAQNKKIYMEGYLSRRDHLNAEGKPLNATDPKKRWHLCFVQLSGTVLSVWSVQQMEEAARQGTEVPPSYINVTDCFVDFVGTITETPQEVPGTRGRYENVFAINTAGQNRILFGVEGAVGRRLVQAWINGIRLASWEKVRLEEIYTGSLVRARLGAVSAQQATSGPGGAPGNVEMTIKSPLSKGGRMEGWVKARFMGSTEWRKCWLVLTDKGAEGAAVTTDANADAASVTSQRNSFWKKLKSGDRSSIILGSSSTPSLADTGLSRVEVPPGSNGAPGLACFYESKKAKKPFATLAYASHSFAVYPSRPELVEGSSLFKVEGSFPLSTTISATNRNRQTGWVMIMPELDGPGSKGANAEMMKWCIAFMDAFHLYGRPSAFQWDARNPVSPFFAYPIGPYKDRLFLDRELAEFLDIREERHLANRNNLHGIMAARMRGERTPILPPLPQPNVDSTRSLNGPQPQSAAGSSVGARNNNDREGLGNSNDSQVSAASPQSLPPLNFGRRDESSPASSLHSSTRPPPNSSGDASMASRGGLQPIGERSRENSVMTSLNAATSGGASEPATSTIVEQQENNMSRQGSEFSQVDPRDTSGMRGSEGVNGSSQAGYLSPLGGAAKLDRGQSPSSFRTADHALPTTTAAPETASSNLAAAPVSHAAAPAGATAAAVSSSPSSTSPINLPETKPLNIPRTLQSSGRGAEASSQSTSGAEAPIARKVSDPYGSYDEGALYYINSLADQLPQVPQKSPRRDSATPAATGLTSNPPVLPPPAVAPVKEAARNEGLAPSTNTSSLRPASMQAEGIDQDALAAYSFLDQPPSPNPPRAALPTPAAGMPTISEPAAPTENQPPQSYPSTFGGNKKVLERKQAAQTQAQAQQDAINQPGRGPGGAKKGLKQVGTGQRHAWAEDDTDEEEEEDEEEDEEEEEEQKREQEAKQRGQQPKQPSTAEPIAVSQNNSSASVPPVHPLQNRQASQSGMNQMQPSYSQQQRHTMFNQHLGSGHDDRSASFYSQTPTTQSTQEAPSRSTFVNLGQDEQPGAMTAAFQPHGLLQAGAIDKAERSAKQQEAMARAEGTHMVSVDGKPPPPQAGLLGAITAHERDRKKDGGIGATLTERERERVQAERRQREEEVIRMQQQQQMMQQQQQQMMAGGQGQPWGGMPFNPMMWQQMQMMSMMNPHMMMSPSMYGGAGGQGSSSQLGHGGTPGSASSHGPPGMSPEALAAQQHAQMIAAQAAQQAYMAALSQHGGGSMLGGEAGGMPASQSMGPGMGMMPFNPFMSMYGAPSMGGFPGMMGSAAGTPQSEIGQLPQQARSPPPGHHAARGQERQSNNSPLRR